MNMKLKRKESKQKQTMYPPQAGQLDFLLGPPWLVTFGLLQGFPLPNWFEACFQESLKYRFNEEGILVFWDLGNLST